MYPIDRRLVAINIYSKLQSLRKTGLLLQVCHTTISRWLKSPKRCERKRPQKVLKSDTIVECIKKSIKNDPFISVLKLQKLLLESLSLNVSRELVRIAIKRLGFSRKKAKFYGEPKNLESKIKQFIEKRNEYLKQGKIFLSIDETSFGRNSFEYKGYSEIGKKLFVRKKFPRMTSTSVIACASSNGWIKTQSSQKANNTKSFLHFLQSLSLENNMVILLDNVSFHHSKIVKDFLSSKNVDVLYTPPYCPWFNPIELCFSNVKRNFRRDQDIEQAFVSVQLDHFSKFFQKSLHCVEAF